MYIIYTKNKFKEEIFNFYAHNEMRKNDVECSAFPLELLKVWALCEF